MMRMPLFLRRALYVTRGGFLLRPMVIAVTLGALGMALPVVERWVPAVDALAPSFLFPAHTDPQVAQAILSGIATSIMTVVSIVFAILLMTITLASMQFSPRILVSFQRDRVTQWTLGIFLGTFNYCMAALPAARFAPHPSSPVATVMGAMILAIISVGWLLFFIHHISSAINVNFIVDRIAGETENVIASITPRYRTGDRLTASPAPPVSSADWEEILTVETSGYIRYIDLAALFARAKERRAQIRLARRVGHFVPAGFPLFMISKLDRLLDEDVEALRRAVDIGPTRTLQQDVEFGVLQIVDIALRAISPAVNDPSTAINCIDQLSRVLICWIGREAPDVGMFHPPHVVRVLVPWVTTVELFETAFDQIAHYAAHDAAVTLRLLRAMGDIVLVGQGHGFQDLVVKRGVSLVERARGRLETEDMAKLERRLQSLIDSRIVAAA